jgi:predicted transcriptional regulator
MPIKTKDKLLQIRVEQDLFDRFSALCDRKGYSVSAAIRWSMNDSVSRYEQRVAKDAEWAATLESRSKAASAAESVEKPYSVPLIDPRTPVETAFQKKRRIEKEQKAFKTKKRAEAR